MKTIRNLSIILLLHLLFYGCKGSKDIHVLKEFLYTYNAENFGYSDIKKLYSLDSVTRAQSFFKSESLQHLEMNIQTELKKIVLKRTKDSLLICYQLLNPILDIKTEGVSITLDPIIKDLIKPVFVSTDTYGKIGKLKFDAGISDTATGLYKDILGRIQFVESSKNTKSWQTAEENTLGTYKATYLRENSDGPKKVYSKNILEYLTYKSKKDNHTLKIDNHTTIETDVSGVLKKINTSEAQIMLQNNDTLSVLGSKVSIFESSEENIRNSVISDLLALEKSENYRFKTTLSEAMSDNNIRIISYSNTLDTDSWETLIEQLSTTKNLTKETENRLLLKFRALFYLHPEYCARAVSQTKNESVNSKLFIVISKALSITETPYAIDALALLIEKNKNEEGVLQRLIPVLTTTKHPTNKAIEVIKEIAFGTTEPLNPYMMSTAQLSLGGMAHQLWQIDSLKSNNLTRYLLDKTISKKDTIQQILILGNTRSYLVFPRLKSLINNDLVSKNVKIEAISAVALIDNANVSDFLKKLLRNKEEYIKKEAQKIIDFRDNYFK
ncbi:hypothetical protein [uncultured Winogradskyella sp.]|uniref:hypothetical protein n=1 Tax=uncultured Winogradskyella sp. TaxID=395353 RepID=UPI002604928B|nr:hypothetical protein [uncultured Winogradskyella sp.]